MDNVFTQVIDMDTGIPEQVVKNKDGSYTIFLNARMNWETLMNAYWHATKHIINGDFDKYDSGLIEMKAHELS